MSGNRKAFNVSGNRNDLVNEQDKISFVDFPKDMVQLVGSFITDNDDKANYARVCKQVNNFFQPDLDKQALEKLLPHVAFGEKAQAEEMIKCNPCLLLEKIKVKDEAGRTIYGTAYQIALGAKDVSIGTHEEMAEMIERYLVQLPNGKEERNKQYSEQFPEGFEKEEEARKQRDKDEVEKVFDAVDKATSDQEIEEAINEFKNYLKNENNREFKTGYHFNEAIFIRALELYDKYYEKFGGFDSVKNNKVAVGVFGGMECYFTATLAQAMCDGVRNVVNEKKQLSRNKLLDDNKTSFFGPHLGVTHVVYNYYGGFGVGSAFLMANSHSWFKAYAESKKKSLIKRQNIAPKREPKNGSSICLIQ